MKTAVNAPVAIPQFNVGSINYILAHEALKSQQYFVNNTPQWRVKKYTILDNGADELGAGLSGESLFELVVELSPDELILPDVLKDWNATLEASEKFLYDYGDKMPGVGFMGVCQGRTREEFMNSLYHWLNEPRVNVIGIPYDIDFQPESQGIGAYEDITDLGDKALRSQLRGQRRYRLLSSLLTLGVISKPTHLLGYNTTEELVKFEALGHRFVRSNDSTAPFAAANIGRNYLGPKDWPPLNFSEGKFKVQHLLDCLVTYFAAANDTQALKNLITLLNSWQMPSYNSRTCLEYNGDLKTLTN